MKHFEIIIIGGGASGTMCALSAPCNKKISIIDSGSKIAKKILATGNGKCNLTNENIGCEFKYFYNQDISSYISRFNVQDTLSFFNSLGLETITDNENRVYPLSLSAKSVMDILNFEISKRQIETILNEQVEKIEKNNNEFIVTTNQGKYSCEKVVVASGGNTMKSVLQNLKIEFSPFVPSLCALKTETTKYLSGQRLSDVLVTATNEKGESNCEVGEVLFKDEGLSGVVVFNLSTLFSRNKKFSGTISIDLLKNYTMGDVIEKLNKRKNESKKVHEFLTGLFANAISSEIIKRAKINENKNSSDLSIDEINKIAFVIKNLSFKVSGYYDNNHVFSGGVNLSDVTNSLESKKINGLYFCGEICNVDGICGGYNLQWAWTSGHIVGESL